MEIVQFRVTMGKVEGCKELMQVGEGDRGTMVMILT